MVMVIAPAPLVTLIPLPAVRFASVKPEPLPIKSLPLPAVEVSRPVPPLAAESWACEETLPEASLTKTPAVDRAESVRVPEALMVVVPAIAPVLVMPALLASIPPEAVNSPAEVMVPVPVVAMLPLVERLPSSSIVNFVTPPDLIAKAVPFVPVWVSLMTKALAVPALVKVKEVGVTKLSANVKSMLRPVVVRIVLPRS